MGNFDINKFIGRFIEMFISLPRAIKKAVDENALADSLASVILANIIIALGFIGAFNSFNLNNKFVYISPYKILPGVLLSFNLNVIINMLAFYFVGQTFGGRGTPQNIAVAFGLISFPLALFRSLIRFFGILYYPMQVLTILVEYVACAEAHDMRDPKNIVATVVISYLAFRIAEYAVSMFIRFY